MIFKLLLVLISSALIIQAESWPTYKGSISRTGTSHERLSLPLHTIWTHTSAHSPSPAWPAPAHINIATGQLLDNSMTYDRSYNPVIADAKLYYGSSTDDTIYCLNAKTGALIWKFVTGGPIRIPPAISGKYVLAGSDDGCLYCLDAVSGKQLWIYRGGPEESIRTSMFIGNGRMISRWPIRCGIVVDKGAIYFTSGLFPVEGVFLHSLNIADGTEIWKSKIDVSAQGHMMASHDTLFITTGRNTPVSSFSRKTGKKLSHYGVTRSWGKSLTGGSSAILIDDLLISGPSEGMQSHIYNINTPANKMITINAIGLIANSSSIYVAAPLFEKEGIFQLKSLDRATETKNYLIEKGITKLNAESKKLASENKSKSKSLKEKKKSEKDNLKQIQQLETEILATEDKLKVLSEKIKQETALKKDIWSWKVTVARPSSLLLDANKIYAGFDGAIHTYSLSSGAKLWAKDIKGRVCNMAISDGSLFASTDNGTLYCFRADVDKNTVAPKTSTSIKKSSPFPEILQSALKKSGLEGRPGFCLIVDAVDGTLALAATETTGCRVILLSNNPETTDRLRVRIAQAGVYGSRVTVHEIKNGEMPFPPYFADLIMSEAAFLNKLLPANPKQIYRYLRPDGGILALILPRGKAKDENLKEWGIKHFPEWKVAVSDEWAVGLCRRAALDGAGEWNHEYAESGGSSNSGDTLVNLNMDIQWFGEPGPARMVDRHFRNIPPLYKDGRLFVPGNDLIYGVNPYNGSILWEKEVPGSRRTGAFLDAGSMAVDESSLYIARGGECLALDVETGRQVKTFNIPGKKPDETLEWGLVGYTGNTLLGSTCTKGASYSILTKKANKNLWQLGMPVVTSLNIFALDKKNGSEKWIYSGGKILNTSIVFNNQKIFFLEVSGSSAATNTAGRMRISELFSHGNQELVALSITSGKEIFRSKINAVSFTEPVYLQLSKRTLVLSGSKPEEGALRYSYYAYNANTGALNWQASHVTFPKKANDGHGQQNRHPVIADNMLYAWPCAYRLDTGEKIDEWSMDRRGHGCGGVSASESCLFWRGGNPWMISPMKESKAKRLTSITRPGCWINIIPAGGLIMIPETSAGCTCGYSIQTSLTFGPRITK